MKEAIRVGLVGLWVLLASGFLTRWWITSPNSAVIPDFPPSFWRWLIDLFDAHDQKSIVVIFVGLCLSLIVVSLLTLLGWFLWRCIKAR
jgi:hypothetical protein